MHTLHNQVASIFFQPSFLLSSGSAGATLLVPLLQLLALGLSGAAVTNYIQSVRAGAGHSQLDWAALMSTLVALMRAQCVCGGGGYLLWCLLRAHVCVRGVVLLLVGDQARG
jgi:uncharacterized membrane protein